MFGLIAMNIRIEKSNDDLQKHSGIVLIDNILKNIDIKKFDYLSNRTPNKRWIPNSSVVKSAIILQCFAMPNFQDIKEMNEDTLFRFLNGCKISPETYRQRMDYLAKEDAAYEIIDKFNVEVLKNRRFNTTSFNGKEYYTVDIDVTPFCNPNVHKEGVSCTYKMVDGFAPIMAYLGQYAIAFDLREGSQHSEKGAVEFLNRVLKMVREIGIPMDKVLVRVDSGHDDSKFTDACIETGVNFIVKRNHRRETYDQVKADIRATVSPVVSAHGNHRVYYQLNRNVVPAKAKNRDLYTVFKLVEDYTDAPLFAFMDEKDRPCELSSYWTNLDIVDADNQFGLMTAKECDRLYREHATSEQYHSELKSDMNMELLPSKYFATNKLFLQLAALSFNILRIIGDEAIEIDENLQHHKNVQTVRIRLRTVIDKICTIACKIVHHSRMLFIKFGRKAFFYDTFVKIYEKTC